jgi:hypothetical protein
MQPNVATRRFLTVANILKIASKNAIFAPEFNQKKNRKGIKKGTKKMRCNGDN